MFTPQQIDQITLKTAVFGGYDIDSVDAFLEPLCQDYVTLYKENALLKTKMRVLVDKLEEYRSNEASMKDALMAAQKAADNVVREAEVKAAKLMSDAEASANINTMQTEAMVAAEQQKVDEARTQAIASIDEVKAELTECLAKLEEIKSRQAKAIRSNPAPVSHVVQPKTESLDDVADEISKSLEKMVGSEPAPVARPATGTGRLSLPDSVTEKFANLQFGKNYDPTKR